MSAGLELQDDATREDVDAMVKSFMEGQKSGDTSKEKDTSKEISTGDDAKDAAGDDAAAGVKPDGEDSAQKKDAPEAKTQDWLTDDVRAELPRWVSDEDLSGFSSRDELDRALGLLNRSALKAGSDAGGEEDDSEEGVESGQRGQKRGEDGKFVKKDRSKPPEPDGSSDLPEIDLDLSEFDEDLNKKITGAFKGLRDHYEGRMKELDERFSALEAENRARQVEMIEARFDAAVDSLGAPKLFGVTGKESSAELEARGKLLKNATALVRGHKTQFGHDMTLEEGVQVMYRAIFPDYIAKQHQKTLTKQIVKQSNMRMGVGAERPGEQAFKGPLKSHPDVQRAYKELQEARGEG